MRPVRLLAVLGGLAAIILSLTATRADDKAAWGTVKGTITFKNAPPAKPANVNNDAKFCMKDGPVVYEDIVVGKTGGLKNVIVWLREDDADPKTKRKTPFPADKIHPDLAKAKPVERVIDQPCCQFIPRVLAARAGDTLIIKNSATVNHNINYTSDAESFNVNVPPGQSHKATSPLAAQSTPIPFKCDVHSWMAGRMRVFDHPYFAVTDDKGEFEIKNTPTGKWRVVYWHEGGYHKGRDGIDGIAVDIKGGSTLELPITEFEFPK